MTVGQAGKWWTEVDSIVSSATRNENILSEQMPAYVDYLNSLPSVYDMFKSSTGGDIPVLYTDKEFNFNKEQKAFVFKAENTDNDFNNFNINQFLK